MAPLLRDKFFDRIVELFNRSGVVSNSASSTSSSDASNLTQRLFYLHEDRHHAGVGQEIANTASRLEERGVFFHHRVLMFAKASQNTMNMHSWLEAVFGLEVVMIHEHTMFAEWLYRYAASVDFLILERDSFEDESSFARFLVKARESADDLPLIVMGTSFTNDDFEPRWYDAWDISLRIPVSQVSCWMLVKKAAEITMNGRT